jgi:hypothetical protein
VVRRMGTFAIRPLAPGFETAVSAPQFLAGALLVLAISSLTHEILHFRNVWVLLGLVAAISLWGRPEGARVRANVAGGRSGGEDGQ